MNITPPLYQTSLGTPRDIGSLLSMKSQGFGDNVAYYSNTAIWPHPTNGHPGIDWPCAIGTPIYASITGTVKSLATDFRIGAGFGAGIIIECPDGETLTWHLSRIDVSLNQSVVAGQQIGLSGNSGVSSGPHCHLEWRPYPLVSNNGFYGAADPAPLLSWIAPQNPSDSMTQEEVVAHYVLAFYREPTVDELNYWVGKKSLDFLKTAIADRSNFLKLHE